MRVGSFLIPCAGLGYPQPATAPSRWRPRWCPIPPSNGPTRFAPCAIPCDPRLDHEAVDPLGQSIEVIHLMRMIISRLW